MSINNSEISLYVDSMLIQTIIEDGLVKKAQAGSFIAPLIDKVKSYMSGHIDPNNKVDSIINFLAPTAISSLLGMMGFKWIGVLTGILTSALHIDIGSILHSIFDKIKSLITGDANITSSQIDSITQSVAQEHAPEDSATANDHISSASSEMCKTRMLKLAMIQYESTGFIRKAQLSGIIGSQAVKIFTKIIGWIFKTVLASAGMMAAGDVVNKLVGRSNALDGTLKGNKPTTPETGFVDRLFHGPSAQETGMAKVTATQTKFPLDKSYVDTNMGARWVEQNVINNRQSIENMLVGFAKEVYTGLDNLDSVIRSAPTFKTMAQMIEEYNDRTPNDRGVWMPAGFTSKKQMVDYFIDYVAAKAP
jgi:hypothetical protein